MINFMEMEHLYGTMVEYTMEIFLMELFMVEVP